MIRPSIDDDLKVYSRSLLRGVDFDLDDETIAQIHKRALERARAEHGDVWLFGKYLRAIAEFEMDGYYG